LTLEKSSLRKKEGKEREREEERERERERERRETREKQTEEEGMESSSTTNTTIEPTTATTSSLSPPTKRLKSEETSSTASSSSALEGAESTTKAEDGNGQQNHDPQVHDPFTQLRLSSQEHLNGLNRVLCPNCKQRRKYYCYDCYTPFGEPGKTPRLTLPCIVDV